MTSSEGPGPAESFRWALARRDLSLHNRCLVMGIVNVTPDSFSDGGRHDDPGAAIAHALSCVEDGADILDIGGESTRPGAAPVSLEVELDRVLPVVAGVVDRVSVPISIDTQKAEVARRAIEAGASIVNDVSGLRADPDMAAVVAAARAGLVMMHMKGTPETMQRRPSYDDLFAEMNAYFEEGFGMTDAAGIRREAIVLDPGIGFGKTLEHNLALLANPDALAGFGRPLLVGVSRKSIFEKLLGLPVDARDDVSNATAAMLALLGVSIVRVHDVKRATEVVAVATALRRARRPARADVTAGAGSADPRRIDA